LLVEEATRPEACEDLNYVSPKAGRVQACRLHATHRARAFLFKNGLFIKEMSVQLAIQKSGVEQSIFRAAHEYSLFYGYLPWHWRL